MGLDATEHSTVDPGVPAFWDARALDVELRRVFDICHGCRLCLPLCPSFPALFDAIDTHGESVEGLTESHLRRVVDLCYQCKICFVKCPYTPPHRYQLDFPRLMLRARAVRARREGITLSDWLLGRPDLVGAAGTRLAPIANWANENAVNRWVMEKTLGIHRQRVLPRFAGESFEAWRRDQPASPGGEGTARVALFATCSVNYNDPDVGKAALAVLRRNGIEVEHPHQVCCGMPHLDGGDIFAAREKAERNVAALAPLAARGLPIVVPGPTCAYTLKQEYPVLVPTPEAKAVAAATRDLGEFLWAEHRAGRLRTDFSWKPGRIVYHVPCHLKAQQIGLKSRDVLALIPGAEIEVVEKCAGIDGTWGLKEEFFQLSKKIGDRMCARVEEERPDWVATDCPLAGLALKQGLGRRTYHSVQILARAYGLGFDGAAVP
ncbi:MAG: anaerobic glycerol-3-phosphate dehydrogenase subunit C [Planctomycetes bacterium]|nr:anaerobic glycerol-3-phosphate dehydrogenase subunit C [Planctomycetota bacterium]